MKNESVRQVRTFDDLSSQSESENPSGLVFSPLANRFLLLEPSTPNANISELGVVSPFEETDENPSVSLSAALDPLNTTFDTRFNRFLGFNRNDSQLIIVQANADGVLLPSTLTRIDTKAFEIKDAQGLTVDAQGVIFALDGATREIVRIQPDDDGGIAAAAVSKIKLPREVVSPQGIAFDPSTGNLTVLSLPNQQLYELTPAGTIESVRDLSQLDLDDPQSLAFAPSGDLTDDAEETSLYVADRDPDGGGITEVSLVESEVTVVTQPQTRTASQPQVQTIAQPQVVVATTPTFVQTILTSNFSPTSPDPSGITFRDSTGNLVVTDGEVNEEDIFEDVNVWEVTTSGTEIGTGNTLDFGRDTEPNGLSYNPTNGHFFFSNDETDNITETDGSGLPGNIVNQFRVDGDDPNGQPINSEDPEGVAYAVLPGGQEVLFIADGLNNEVYRLSLDGDLLGQFDTESSGFLDPEGIVYDPLSNHLFVAVSSQQVVGKFLSKGWSPAKMFYVLKWRKRYCKRFENRLDLFANVCKGRELRRTHAGGSRTDEASSTSATVYSIPPWNRHSARQGTAAQRAFRGSASGRIL